MQSGEVLGGRFEIEHLAGSGGMGMVYRALDRRTGKRVAVKVCYRRGTHLLQRFEREARCLARLNHPGIVRYLAHGLEPQQAYLVMEWLEGESLAARLARARLTLAEAVALAIRVAEALVAAHAAGVVHRDLKPSNLFLVDGALDRVEIIDFGLARGQDGGAPITATGATLGTPGYMAPEQVKRPRDVDYRADLFSLGCVLFHALTGAAPFEGKDPLAMMMATASEDAPRVDSFVDGVPASLDDVVARLLSREPENRLGAGGDEREVATALRALEAEVKAKHLGWSVPAAARARRGVARDARRSEGSGEARVSPRRGRRRAREHGHAGPAADHRRDPDPPRRRARARSVGPGRVAEGREWTASRERGAPGHAPGDGRAPDLADRARGPRRLVLGVCLLHLPRAERGRAGRAGAEERRRQGRRRIVVAASRRPSDDALSD